MKFPNFKKKFSFLLGFTLAELLMIAFVILLLTSLILPHFRLGERKFALERSANKLAQDIRRAQAKTMAAEEFRGLKPKGYGIYLTENSNSYILFADCNENKKYDLSGTPCGDFSEKVEEIKLEKKVKIGSLSPSPLNIVFISPDPTTWINESTSNSALITLILENRPSQSKIIIVNPTGSIEIE
jgi:Tfp pilus assembly protein FimT